MIETAAKNAIVMASRRRLGMILLGSRQLWVTNLLQERAPSAVRGFAPNLPARGLTMALWRLIYPVKRYRIIGSGPRGARFFIAGMLPRRVPAAIAPHLDLLGFMGLNPLLDRLTEIIAPVVETEGFELVRVRLTGSSASTLQVMAERPDKSMSAEDCAKLSRALSPVLDAADPIGGNYTLEISSPGIDRPLVRLKDFSDWEGWPAKLELNRLVEGRKRFIGVLAGVDDGKVAFDIENETETALFPIGWIASAKLVLTDELIKESLKAGKESTPQQETPHGEYQ